MRLREIGLLGPFGGGVGLVVAAFSAFFLAGCGLGWIEIVPEQYVDFRIENAAPNPLNVTIVVGVATEQQTTGSTLASATGMTTTETSVLVPAGNVTSGSIRCGSMITVTTQAADASLTAIELAGDGTGTPGFDSGSAGTAGERFLLLATHFDCGDTVVIQLSSFGLGQITVVGQETAFPDPVMPIDAPDTPDQVDPTPRTASVRLENATFTAVDITINAQSEGDFVAPEANPAVRVPAGQYSTGTLACGATYMVAAAMADAGASTVLLTGDGTGTVGFDSSSIGLTGERLLVFGEHYACDGTIVVRITDDGSGIGLSTSDTPLGEVEVYATGEAIPDPNLPDFDQLEETELTEEVTVVVVNAVESTLQVNFATGNGTLASSLGTDVSSEFDVRVPSGATTIGTGVCAQEYMIAASHLESTGTTFAQGGVDIFEGGGNINFHAVVLTGDGTGTDGFDSNSIAVARGRLFQLGTHFNCGDTITIIVTATNNRTKVDEEGLVVLDEVGDPTIHYGVGNGSVYVTSGG